MSLNNLKNYFQNFLLFVLLPLNITNKFFSTLISQCSIEHKLYYNIFQAQEAFSSCGREVSKDIAWLVSLEQRFKLVALS